MNFIELVPLFEKIIKLVFDKSRDFIYIQTKRNKVIISYKLKKLAGYKEV